MSLLYRLHSLYIFYKIALSCFTIFLSLFHLSSFSAKAFQKIIWGICPHEVQKLCEEDEKVRFLRWCMLVFFLQKMETMLTKNLSCILIHFVCETFHDTRPGEWGDHLTLQAAADRVSGNLTLFAPLLNFSYLLNGSIFLKTIHEA
jgi:hypothetical protein